MVSITIINEIKKGTKEMSERTDLDDLTTNGLLGDWCFYNDAQDMFLLYPFGHILPDEPLPHDIVHLYLCKEGETPTRTPSWIWNGNREAPTLTPSINVIGRWHGWLKAGKLETAQ